MQIISRAFGIYGTNCYVVILDSGEVIIDPGDGALEWIEKVCKNPLAILCTHGHFDHIYDCEEIRSKFNTKIYIPKDDAFMCENDPFGLLKAKFKPDIMVDDKDEIELGGVKFRFHHFAGHTPGSSVITAENVMFSGDFIFKNAIGRCDLKGGNITDMRNSLIKMKKYDRDILVYPGHGDNTFLGVELDNNIDYI